MSFSTAKRSRLTNALLALVALLPFAMTRGNPPLAEELPAHLPRYAFRVDVPSECGRTKVSQTVTWTNPASRPTDEVVFNVYPRHRPTEKQRPIYERTMESFRIDPKIAIDREGRRFHLKNVRADGVGAEYCWDASLDTVLHVKLRRSIHPGESVVVELEYELEVTDIHYRVGHWKGVTNFLNWYPIVAYYGDEGWMQRPFVGWHQPWLNEAGIYDIQLRVPPGQEVVSSGQTLDVTTDADGYRLYSIRGEGLRDFSFVMSKRHEIHESEIHGVKVSVHAFPEHRFYARFALQSAIESIDRYTRLIGPYPYPEFKVVESYFGWNGNETSGMVLIDERVFDAPKLGHIYVDHLVSHETLHQWWYAAVGTDGYSETWMDEALVSHMTESRIHEKYGEKIDLLDLPHYVRFLPNIDYDSFMHNGYYLYLARGGKGKVLAPLEDIGNVHYLFFLAYDRGGRVVRMIHSRLGDERFHEFLRIVYAKYRFRVIFVADFQRELEDFTGQSWQQFFDDWLRSNKQSDWKVTNVDIKATESGFETTTRIKQKGEIAEPVPVSVFTGPEKIEETQFLFDPSIDTTPGVQRIDEDEWEITLQTREKPRQVAVDPHNNTLDSNPSNNRWKIEPAVRFTPIYTPLDEVSLVRPLDRPSFAFGPSIDVEGRVGLRGSLMEVNRYRFSPYLVYPFTPNDGVFAAGVDGELMNFPLPNVSILYRYERTLASELFSLPRNQGEVALRWNQLYTTSFFYPNLMYTDVFFRFGDNFFPDENFRPPDNPLAEIYRDIRALGARFHLDTRMPYWNPDSGFAFDATFENGWNAYVNDNYFLRGFGQISAVRRLPDGLGYLSMTKLATRLRGGIGGPDRGEHFHFGGPLGFRGQRSEDTEGNAYWLTGVDWRFPLLEDVDKSILDSVARFDALYAALLYDVGESFILGSSQGVDHAVGLGLYYNLGLFSFVERVTLRTEYAHSLRYGTDMVWFGVFYAY